jgi:hypothetical protein
MRPLYLGSAARGVRLDGPALSVAVDGHCETRVPLRLLSRVISPLGIEWSTAALTACLGFGVPVAFFRSDGAMVGLCLPAARRQLDLNRRLDALEAEPRGRTAFDNWSASEERRAILALVGRRRPDVDVDLRPQILRTRILAALDANADRVGALLLRLEGLLAGHLGQLLIEAGLSARRAGPAAGRLDLFAACMAAARWELVPTLHDAVQHRRLHPEAWSDAAKRARRLARRYEHVAPKVAASQRRRLRRLDAWLWEMEA